MHDLINATDGLPDVIRNSTDLMRWVTAAVQTETTDPAVLYLQRRANTPASRKQMAMTVYCVAKNYAWRTERTEWQTMTESGVRALLRRYEEGDYQTPFAKAAKPGSVSRGRPRLTKGLGPQAINARLAAIKGIALACSNLKLMASEDYLAIQQIPQVRFKRRPVGTLIRPEMVGQMTKACLSENTPRGLRDAALIGLCFSTGARRGEIAGIKVPDILWDRQQIKVLGKGNQERLVSMSDDAYELVRRWMDCRGWDDAGPLFYGFSLGGQMNRADPLSKEGIYYTLIRRLQSVLEPGQTASPHDFRRSLATLMRMRGETGLDIRDELGHASIATTEKAYIMGVGDEARKRRTNIKFLD